MQKNVESEVIVDARKQSMGKHEALALAKSVKQIYSCKGSKVVNIHMQDDKPSDERLLEALLGPTGNLRAPTIKIGDLLMVGFNAELFSATFQAQPEIARESVNLSSFQVPTAKYAQIVQRNNF